MNRKESTEVSVVDRQDDLKACPIMMKFYNCLQPQHTDDSTAASTHNGMIFRCGLIFECLFYLIFYTTHRFPYLCLSCMYRFLYSISQVYFIRTIFELFVELFYDTQQMVLSIVGFVMMVFLSIMRYLGQLVLKCCCGPDSPSSVLKCCCGPDSPSSIDERRALLPSNDLVDRGKKSIYCCGESTAADIESLLAQVTQAKIVINFNAW